MDDVVAVRKSVRVALRGGEHGNLGAGHNSRAWEELGQDVVADPVETV
jgi:hypothetical protein